jgi:aminopeptidase-like protein
LDIYRDVVSSLEQLEFFVNKEPNGEVMLSKHNLYRAMGGSIRPKEGEKSELQLILWLLFYLDGHMPLSKVARKLQVPEDTLRPVVDSLVALHLVERV